MGARSEVGVPLSCGVVLVAEEGLHVVQRDAVLHQPGGSGVPHDPGREAADLVPGVIARLGGACAFPELLRVLRGGVAAQPGGGHGRIPHSVAEMPVADGYRAAAGGLDAPERGPAARMEVRLGDATANPYLAMAAIGAPVYLGIRDKAEPPPKLEGYGYDPGRSQMLPMRLGEALDALESDRDLTDVLGEYFVTSFLTYKRNEIERFERYVTDWEFREYAYHL